MQDTICGDTAYVDMDVDADINADVDVERFSVANLVVILATDIGTHPCYCL
jgi:hypothetical protein